MTRPAPRVSIPDAVRPPLEAVGQTAADAGLEAYAVGGCVRDWLLNRAQTVDVDVVIVGDGIAVARAAAERLRASVTVHQQFGTATLMLPARARIDVTSARKETYTKPAAYPRVQAGTMRDDLFRRDFTINAMAASLDAERFGELLDLYGGRQDLQAKRLRVLHPKSFIDDPSRILRGVRFCERFGLTVEPATEQALRRALADGLLATLNRGRIRKELDRLTEEPDPVACLKRLSQWLSWAARA